jgi:hypothetical protein
MIVIYTDYDPVAAVLQDFAQELIRRSGAKISLILGPPNDSLSTNIQSRLVGLKDPVFFFGHGVLGALMGQDQQAAIDGSQAHLLNDRIVYAACCDGIPILSQAVKTYSATVIGYRGALMVPVSGRRYQNLMRTCVLSGADQLMNGVSAAAARNGVEQAFRKAAQRLIATRRVWDAVMSVQVFDWNANRVEVDGDGKRTM